MNSMTGFGSKEKVMPSFGKICFEIRSTNHKFLEAVFHLPPGFISLEDKLKKEIEARIKRGRIVCVMNISGGAAQDIFVNKSLLKNYVFALKNIRQQFHLEDKIQLDTLIRLPGVLSSTESRASAKQLWPGLRALVRQALDNLVNTRRKEGAALAGYLKTRAGMLEEDLRAIKLRFRKVIKEKTAKIKTDEERASFIKDADITEEIERLTFHLRSFKNKLAKSGPIGKELDFIAQEMQREANTMGAKSCDVVISSRVVQIKSQVEKLREQLQNIE